MSWLDQLAEHVEELRQAGHLQQNGRSAEALPILDEVLATVTDPTTRAYALVQRFGALINLGRLAELATAMSLASNAVRELPDPYLRGQMHAFAALGAYLQRNLDRGVTHLVQASRALAAVPESDWETAWGWHDLAMAYSYLGFHGQALTAIEQARQVGAAVGLSPEVFAAPGIRLRSAVWLDHQGDTDGCLRVLRDIEAELIRFVAIGADRMRPSSRTAYGYALARREALGEETEVDAAGWLTGGGDSVRTRDLHHLGNVCLAIAAGTPLLRSLHRFGLDHRGAKVWIQSFEAVNLHDLRPRTKVNLVFLTSASGSPFQDPRTYAQYLTPAGLTDLSRYVDGIGPDKAQVIPRNADNTLGRPTSLVRDAHAAGLEVIPYTFRAENQFLPADYRVGADPNAYGRALDEQIAFLNAGIDGLFTDQADVGVLARKLRG